MPRTSDTKAKIILEAKDKASRQIKKVDSSFAKLVAGVTAGNIAANIASKAFSSLGKGVRALIDATKVAARIQVLNRVFLLTGQNAGHTKLELEGMKQEVMDLGIAEQEALQIGQQFIQAQLDIADATLVARAAQDLAVIAGTNSSETALRLTDAIVKQRPILLKQFGIIANLNDIYGRQADALGKTRDQLNETEKRAAFLNEILRQSKTVAGAYESAMKDVGKRMTSLPRHMQNAQNAVGKLFLPVMLLAVDGTTDFLKSIKALADALDTSLATSVKRASQNMREFTKTSTKLNSLAGIYDKLKGQVKLTSGEQERLTNVTKDLAEIVPDAVTAWDEYGEALEISTEKIDAFITAQQTIARLKIIETTGGIADEFQRLADIDTKGIAMQMGQLKTTIDEIEASGAVATETIRKGIVVWRSPLAAAQFQLAGLNEQLLFVVDKKKEMTAFASTLFPNLTKGTVAYKDAVIVLNQALADAVVLRQAEATARTKAIHEGKREAEELARLKEQEKAVEEFFIELLKVRREAQRLNFEDYGLQQGVQREMDDQLAESNKKIMEDQTKRTGDEIKRRHALTAKGVSDELALHADAAEQRRVQAEHLTNALGDILNQGLDRMVDDMFTAGKSFTEIFQDMAEDFAKFFIKQALASIANLFIPGLGVLLGGIFDKRQNDLMAMTQGRHFSEWFTRGALGNIEREFIPAFAGAVSGANVGAGIGQVGSAPGPAMVAGTAAGNIFFEFHGPVTGSDFVQDEVVPLIDQVVSGGTGSIVVDKDNLTGSDHAQFI